MYLKILYEDIYTLGFRAGGMSKSHLIAPLTGAEQWVPRSLGDTEQLHTILIGHSRCRGSLLVVMTDP